MFDRILRAIRLEPALYRQVANNPALMQEATLIAVATAILGSMGVLVSSSAPLFAFIASVANYLLIGWLLWAFSAYFVGTRFFNGRSTPAEMARVLGYATAPRLLGLFSFIPCVGWIIAFVGSFLSIIAAIIAIREAMEFDTNKAGITAVVGFAIFIIVNIIISMTFSAIAMPFAG